MDRENRVAVYTANLLEFCSMIPAAIWQEGEAWYPEHLQRCADIAAAAGIAEVERVILVASALCANVSYPQSMVDTRKMCLAWRDGASAPIAANTGINRNKAWSVLTQADYKSVIKGKKCTHFTLNTLGDLWVVTTDRHHMEILSAGLCKSVPSGLKYDDTQLATQMVANILGRSPRTTQAGPWVAKKKGIWPLHWLRKSKRGK
jgi:hypothetical protein